MRRVTKATSLIASTMAATLLAGAYEAHAQDQDTTGIFMRDVLGTIGIIEPQTPRIEYRERAPLVLPPGSQSLPPPRASVNQVGNQAAGQAEWPRDPDVAARARAAAEANAPVPTGRDREAAARPLSPNELRSRGSVRAGAPTEPDSCTSDSCSARPLNPRELRRLSNSSTKEDSPPPIAYGQEPERKTLAQPPKGYRLPAANAPIPASKDAPIVQEDIAKPQTFIRQQATQGR